MQDAHEAQYRCHLNSTSSPFTTRKRGTHLGYPKQLQRAIVGFVLVRPDYIEHQLAHAVRDPNGRAYNRTAHLAERPENDAAMGRLSG